MDHDGLLKKLLKVFFYEFVDSFLPSVAAYIERDSVEFLDKETFGATRSRKRREMGLVAKVRLKNAESAFFLIHIEHQSTNRRDFPRRMLRYYTRLMDKYDLPVYPIVVFSHDALETLVPSS